MTEQKTRGAKSSECDSGKALERKCLAQKLIETAAEQGATVEDFIFAMEYARTYAMRVKLNVMCVE